jgi:hypothetical protein
MLVTMTPRGYQSAAWSGPWNSPSVIGLWAKLRLEFGQFLEVGKSAFGLPWCR